MAHIKNLSNRAYISGSLKDKLSRFEMYRYSFIYAPTGYGKSKVIRTFFKNYPGYTVLWIDAESSREIFWDNFCNAVKMFDNTLAAAFKKIGFPDSDYAINEVINLLSIMNSEKVSALLVIDNFDDIFDDNMCRIFAASYLSTAVTSPMQARENASSNCMPYLSTNDTATRTAKRRCISITRWRAYEFPSTT